MTEAALAKQRPSLSVGLLFAPVFVAVYLLHWTLLRLPYYWDEGSYYIPAAWDFFRLGTLIPETTMRNAHPPLPSILLAGWWKLAGFHIYSTRLLMCLVTTAALLAVFRLTRMLVDDRAAVAAMVLTAIYPVWFAQSTLAHADMFAAAFTLWALVFYAGRLASTGQSTVSNAISSGLLFALAAQAKETAIVLPATLFLLEAWLLFRSRGVTEPTASSTRSEPMLPGKGASSTLRGSAHDDGRGILPGDHPPGPNSPGIAESVIWLAAMAFPALPLFGWYLYHRAKTGFMFGNPEFLRYNATANLSALRVLLSLWHRMTHLTVHMNLFVPVLATCALLFVRERSLRPGPDAHTTSWRELSTLRPGAARMLVVLLLAQWIAFSVLGGALLTRYLLPAYPLLLILCVAVWQSRTRYWPAIAGASLLAFAIGCEVAPPYPFTPEDNLVYRDMIVVHQHAIHELLHRYPGATVLTAWPVAADLQRPELGYLRIPMHTVNLENFSSEEIAKAATNPGAYDVALVFATKYDPPPGGLNLTGANRANDRRFYDYHRDLLPGEIARALGGTIMWQEDRKGEWAALLSFPRGYDARLTALPERVRTP